MREALRCTHMNKHNHTRLRHWHALTGAAAESIWSSSAGLSTPALRLLRLRLRARGARLAHESILPCICTHTHIRINHTFFTPHACLHPEIRAQRPTSRLARSSPRSGGPSTRAGALAPPPEGPGRAWRMARSSSSSSSSESSEDPPPPGPLLGGAMVGEMDFTPFLTAKMCQPLEPLATLRTMLMVSHCFGGTPVPQSSAPVVSEAA